MVFSVSFNNKLPIHEQITEKVETLILSGVLEKDSPLPSVRELACELAINPNTVQKAYATLEQNGITYSVNGKGRFVAITADNLKEIKSSVAYEGLEKCVLQLRNYGCAIDSIVERIEAIYKGGDKE